jgi:hypothetical protein
MPLVSKRFSPNAGIALGPILFILAILGILAAVLGSGSTGFSTAGITDRIAAEIPSQANLIRSKINECNLMYGTTPGNYDGFPFSGAVSIAISTVTCNGDPSTPVNLQNVWSGNRPSNLPPPTNGFGNWNYMNSNTDAVTVTGGTAPHGRCIWIKPTNPSGSITDGLIKSAKKFTTSAHNDGASEVNFDPTSTYKRFVVWISAPPAAGQEDNDCNSSM